MKKILITAFEPFGEDTINPTAEIISALPDRITFGCRNKDTVDKTTSDVRDSVSADPEAELIRVVLPVSFIRAAKTLEDVVREYDPDIVVSLGLAGGRAAVTPERIAVNCMDARIPDNDGYLPADLPVVSDGPAAYFSTLPIKKIRDAVRKDGIPSEISNSAGTYVCNAVMYRMLHMAAKSGGRMRCGFIHVPYIDGMGKEPSMSLDDEIRAIIAAVRACI